MRDIRGFVFRPVRLFMSRDHQKNIEKQVKAFQKKPGDDDGGKGVLTDSVSLLAVRFQSAGSLRQWVTEQHEKIKGLAELLQGATFTEDGKASEIDAALLTQKRQQPPDDLDHALLNGRFGTAYRKALTEKMVKFLFARLQDKKTGASTLWEIDRHRLTAAIAGILEDC